MKKFLTTTPMLYTELNRDFLRISVDCGGVDCTSFNRRDRGSSLNTDIARNHATSSIDLVCDRLEGYPHFNSRSLARPRMNLEVSA